MRQLASAISFFSFSFLILQHLHFCLWEGGKEGESELG